MPYNPDIHHRRTIRLQGYDYSQAGAYFITICCQNRASLFGEVINGKMILNDAGRMIESEWLALQNRFPTIELDEFIVMPNHFHGILEIVDLPDNSNAVRAPLVGAQSAMIQLPGTQDFSEIEERAPTRGAPTESPTENLQMEISSKSKTVGDMMDAFKSITTVEYIRGVKNLGWKPFQGKVWQRNYYEHIIRNEQSYQNISDYILNNPAKWQADKYYNS